MRGNCVGQTPWSARVPLDPLSCRGIKSLEAMHLYLRTHYREVEQVNGKWGVMEILERQ